MFTKRIIPCLDVHNGRVVKGVNFVNLRDAGDPVEIAAAYDKAGADELVFLDITASSDARNTVVDMVRKVAEKVFIPFTVGGGVIKELRHQYPMSNIVAIDYDPGASEVNQLNRIKLMLSTANKNLKK